MLLWRAKAATANTIGTLSARHDALEKELDVDKSKAGANAEGAALSPAARLAWNDNDADAVVNATKDRAARQKKLAGLDKRIDDENELSGLYSKWIDLVATQQKSVVNRSLRGIAIILGILLLGLFFDQWVASLLTRTKLRSPPGRNPARCYARVAAGRRRALHPAGIFGPPNNLGTFLGLAGAGLTVALKDFIVGFFGWFVLMGKNGIRIGDLVEINGVTRRSRRARDVPHRAARDRQLERLRPSDRPPCDLHQQLRHRRPLLQFLDVRPVALGRTAVVVPAGRDPYPIVEAFKSRSSKQPPTARKKPNANGRAPQKPPTSAASPLPPRSTSAPQSAAPKSPFATSPTPTTATKSAPN